MTIKNAFEDIGKQETVAKVVARVFRSRRRVLELLDKYTRGNPGPKHPMGAAAIPVV